MEPYQEWQYGAPVIVGVNGTAGGGGFSLAITGDIIYAVKDAKFTLAYTNAGYHQMVVLHITCQE